MTDEHRDQNGTHGSDGGATVAEAAKRVITQKRLALPRADFGEVRPLVEAMVRLNGPSSRNLIFGEAGAAATGGTAKTKWAALGYYGFRHDLPGGKHDVTDRGRALVSGDGDAERHAKQHALVATGFRPLIRRFSTRPVSEKTLAGVLRDDFGVPEEAAATAAALVVKLATEAGIIGNGVFQAGPIEEALEAVPEKSDESSPAARAAESKPRLKPSRTVSPQPAPQERVVRRTTAAESHAEGKAGPFGVSVEVKIDASNHTPEEVGQIVRRVREALETKTS